MIKKQDIAKARTPSDLERRYNFGQSFAEAMGLAQDAQKAADIAQKAAEEAQKAVDELDDEAIFNLLTNNGTIQGLYRGDDGQIYINASYVKSGILYADLVNAGILKSKDGTTFYLDLDNGVLQMQADSLSIGGKTVETIATEKAQSAVDNQTQTDIFRKLTNNGDILGLFMENGQLYINASYLKSGTISANLIDTDSLVAKKLTSENGNNCLVIDSAQVQLTHKGKEAITLWNDPTASYARPVISVDEWESDGSSRRQAYFSGRRLALCAHEYNPYGKIHAYTDEYDNDRPHIEIDSVEQDYIVEQSTSGIWTYKKWASGIKECWGTVTHTVTVNKVWGSLYESAAVGNIDFPVTFDSVPSLQLSVVGTSEYAVLLEYPYKTSSTTVSNTGGWHYIRPDAINTSFTVTTAIRVIGK